MVKNSLLNIFPFLLAADLMIPFLLAPTCGGYNHLTQVMSVLGSGKAPLHLIYNIWLIIFGAFVLMSGFQLYLVAAKLSRAISILLFSVMAIYAVGGCILSGFFSVGETKNLETLSAKIHGYGSAIGFLLFTLAPLLVGLYFFKSAHGRWGAFSLVCFVLAIGFFALFIMADKSHYQGTVIALEGLWQRLSLLSMYLPVMALCIVQG